MRKDTGVDMEPTVIWEQKVIKEKRNYATKKF
jgi:hypothetical protein